MTGLTAKLIGIGVVVAMLASLAAYVINRERQDAADDALEQVRKNNEELGKAAEGGALDYDNCVNAGRLWDYGRDRCGGVAPGRRN